MAGKEGGFLISKSFGFLRKWVDVASKSLFLNRIDIEDKAGFPKKLVQIIRILFDFQTAASPGPEGRDEPRGAALLRRGEGPSPSAPAPGTLRGQHHQAEHCIHSGG